MKKSIWVNAQLYSTDFDARKITANKVLIKIKNVYCIKTTPKRKNHIEILCTNGSVYFLQTSIKHFLKKIKHFFLRISKDLAFNKEYLNKVYIGNNKGYICYKADKIKIGKGYINNIKNLIKF